MKIEDILITRNEKLFFSDPYLIAEAGVNHEGDMDIAKRLIDEAAESGANSIKFQTYKASTLASVNSPSYWDTSQEKTESQYELFKKYDKFWKNEYEDLKRYCEQAEIEFLSTPFDVESANFLNELMPAFKISSSDLNNHPFIEHICSFGKPILLSTGASYTWEIQESLEIILKYKLPVCLMHCVLNYPTQNENANLGFIVDLKTKFPEATIGYSDHTIPNDLEILKVAALLGAQIIEKHFTHDKTLKGNDHYHAMDKYDISNYKNIMSETRKIIGSYKNTILESEIVSRDNARRSLVASKKIQKGQIISKDMLSAKRPGTGLPPKYLDSIVGMTARLDIEQDEIINWNHIE